MAGTDVVFGYNIKRYAPPPHSAIVSGMAAFISYHLGPDYTPHDITAYMRHRASDTPLTGEMFIVSRDNHGLDNKGLWLAMALIQQDTMYGTLGKGADLHNPGNVGDDDEGHTRDYGTWQNGVDAVFEWLKRHKVSADA